MKRTKRKQKTKKEAGKRKATPRDTPSAHKRAFEQLLGDAIFGPPKRK